MRKSNLPDQWYTRRSGVIRGPFSADDITRHLLLGRICLNDELSQDSVVWMSSSYCTELLPAELQNLSSWVDYQQLLIARMQVDERKGDRRRQQCSNRSSGHPKQRTSWDRRGKGNDRRVSLYWFGQTNSFASHTPQQNKVRPWLLIVLLVTMLFIWLVPAQR